MKKKLIGFILASAMVVSLAGCGKEPVQITPADDVTEEASVEEEVEEATEEAEEAVEEATTEEAAEEATEEAAEEASDETESGDEFTTGEVNGQVYTNEYFGVKFTAPDGFQFMDDSYLAQLSGVAAEYLENEQVKKTLEDGTQAVVAYAMDANGNSINATCQSNLSLQNAFYSEEDLLKGNVDIIKSSYEAAGITVDSSEIVEVEFAGETHPVLKIAASAGDRKLYQQMAILQKDDYIIAFGTAAVGTDITDELMATVEKIN